MKFFNEYYKESVKKLLTAAEKDLELAKNMCGTLADVLTVEKEYRIAIGASIGVSVQNVITPTMDDARAVIWYLKKNGGGNITFIPVDTVARKVNSEEVEQAVEETGALGLATKLVQYDPYYENAVFYFLGNTLVCDTIDNATVIAKKYPHCFKIVTLDGDVIKVDGTVVGGETQKKWEIIFDDISDKVD